MKQGLQLGKQVLRLASTALALITLAGCTAPGSPQNQPWLTPTPGLGTLDWSTPSFTVPMDAYGMSLRDVQIVEAAHTVLVLRCVNMRHDLSSAELDNVQQWLNARRPPQTWMFGNWDAPYVAANGGQTSRPQQDVPLGPEPLDTNRFVACVNEDPTVLSIQSVSPAYGLVASPPDETMNLIQYWGEGVGRALADPHLSALNKQRNACTQSHGYSIYYSDDGTGGLSYDHSWTDEQRIRAEATEAQCSDDMNYTQQVVDMVATYQLQVIQQHRAELVAIKQTLDQKVADATQILVDLGLM